MLFGNDHIFGVSLAYFSDEIPLGLRQRRPDFFQCIGALCIGPSLRRIDLRARQNRAKKRSDRKKISIQAKGRDGRLGAAQPVRLPLVGLDPLRIH